MTFSLLNMEKHGFWLNLMTVICVAIFVWAFFKMRHYPRDPVVEDVQIVVYGSQVEIKVDTLKTESGIILLYHVMQDSKPLHPSVEESGLVDSVTYSGNRATYWIGRRAFIKEIR